MRFTFRPHTRGRRSRLGVPTGARSGGVVIGRKRTGVVVAAMASLALLAGASVATHSSDPPTVRAAGFGAGQDAPTVVDLTVSCKVAGHTGEARLTLSLARLGGKARWITKIKEYRITPPGGSNSRNRANAKALASVDLPDLGRGLHRSQFNSGDDLKQDGRWHPLGVQGTIDTALNHREKSVDYRMTTYAEVVFVFDVAGSDPQCVAKTPKRVFGSDIKNVTTVKNEPVRDDPIAYCLALTGGGTCRIERTDTKTSTISADVGFTYGWLTARLSYSWSHSRSVTVSQSSPPLNAGELFFAYPTATRYDFDTFVHFWGEQARLTPASAYEIDGGVAHEVIPRRN